MDKIIETTLLIEVTLLRLIAYTIFVSLIKYGLIKDINSSSKYSVKNYSILNNIMGYVIAITALFIIEIPHATSLILFVIATDLLVSMVLANILPNTNNKYKSKRYVMKYSSYCIVLFIVIALLLHLL